MAIYRFFPGAAVPLLVFLVLLLVSAVARAEPATAAASTASADELTEDERQALADYRAKRDREFLDNHPLARARGVSAPPLGGMHR